MPIDKWLFTGVTREEVEQAQRTAAHHQALPGNAQDPLRFLNLSVQERARVAVRMADQAVVRHQRTEPYPHGGEAEFDAGEYAVEIDQLLADLGMVRRSIDAGGADVRLLRSTFDSLISRGTQLRDRLQQETTTGLRNSYLQTRR
jgi:hypothetical protein